MGRPATLLEPPDRIGEVQHLLQQVRQGQSVSRLETMRRRKDGTVIPVALTLLPILNRQGRIVAACTIARDIREQKRLERKMREAEKLESLGILAGGIAHDFNNLLTTIMGNAALAAEMARDQRVRGAVAQIMDASQRAALLTRQMLAYSGKGRFVVQPTRLSTLVAGVSEQFQTMLPPTTQLHLHLAPDLPPLRADAAQMEQLIANLVTNAVEALGDAPGEVTVTTGHDGGRIWLEVHDTGMGMTEEVRDRIFDPFFTTKFIGRGLGLAAVSGIVRSHGGEINVTTAPGKGSTFRVWFPVTES